MPPPKPLWLQWRSLGLFKTSYPRVRWLHRTGSCRCSCSEPSPLLSSKSNILNPTTSNPPIPSADHRTLGATLDLFSITSYSPGSHLFHPSGAYIFLKLQSFLRAQYALFGFREVVTPIIYKQSLWEASGHWENYKRDMFEVTGRGADKGSNEEATEIGEDEKYGLKPMNCPGHCLLFRSQARSYRDLPIRYADFSPLHRNELSGTLSGLTRVRRFHQDDGHIFCRPSQIREEIEKTLAFVDMVYGTFGLGPYKLVLSTRPEEKFMGEVEEWKRAETQLSEALEKSGREWEINAGDGAFYGPKIDIILKDSDGFEHQTATVQLDFQLPQRFGLTYQAPAPELEVKGQTTTDLDLLAHSGDVTPVIIHRAIFGSFERFMALLIEHYEGHWPFWLSPRQAIVLTIGQDRECIQYASRVASKLRGVDKGYEGKPQPLGTQTYQVDTDLSGRSISKKIAEAKTKHYNLICVVGTTETKAGNITVDITGQPQAEEAKGILEQIAKSSPAMGPRPNLRAVTLNPMQLAGFMKGLCDAYL